MTNLNLVQQGPLCLYLDTGVIVLIYKTSRSWCFIPTHTHILLYILTYGSIVGWKDVLNVHSHVQPCLLATMLACQKFVQSRLPNGFIDGASVTCPLCRDN